jgi:3-oxoacyl-[acyl-carrier-protein] synthase II
MTRESGVAVTGMGVVSSIGCSIDTFWQNLIAGTSGVRSVTSVDTTDICTDKGAEAVDFSLDHHVVSDRCPVGLGRSTQFALAAAEMALADAGLRFPMDEPNTAAVIIGTTLGAAQRAERLFSHSSRNDGASLTRNDIAHLPPGRMPVVVARAFGLRGPCFVAATSCASGNYAIGYGCDLIRRGRAEFAVVGGADELSRLAYVGFNRLRALALDRCQPFDRQRRGIVLGEGAAILVLEGVAHARRRGASIHAEIVGHGLGFDAYHVAAPHPEGLGGMQAIRSALSAADLTIDDIDYINAHGTGTVANDHAETVLVKRIFGKQAYLIPISSIKAMLGHTMGAASALEAVACVLALKNGILPPTINYECPDPECDLDYVPNKARHANIRIALSQAFAVGGYASALLMRRHEMA